MSFTDKIVKVFIHPAIGVARVGNSPSEYYFGPEVIGTVKTDSSNFRDAQGRIKREAVKFRLYGADAEGNIIKELTSEDGEIQWTAEVANKKSAWYDFDVALDIPQAKGDLPDITGKLIPPTYSDLRNPTIDWDQRKRLAITPGPIRISGESVNEKGNLRSYAFDKGTFYNPDGPDKKVYLGEVRTDEKGRLIFLGGRGHSASYNDTPATTFANNQTWHDDTSDGPVNATIKLADDRTIEAVGAWVITGPPDYAVGVDAFVTGYDLLLQVAFDAGQMKPSEQPDFWTEIYPILNKLPLNQWVNKGIYLQNGWGNINNFETLTAQLSDGSPENMAFRLAIFQQYRNPNYVSMEAGYIPPVYGDGLQGFNRTDTDPRNFMAILEFQYEYLRQWALGNFTCGKRPEPAVWEKLTPAEQAYHLDRSALDETIGGPFHPGCEFTWPMRHAMMYDGAFRVKYRPDAPLNFGAQIDSEVALAPGGPLDGNSPGDLTRWMAVPWQTDTSSCLSGYSPVMGQYVPTFWPARVPNDVLTQDDFDLIADSNLPEAEKLEVFSRREKWLRGIIYNYTYPPTTIPDRSAGINVFIKKWPDVGIIIPKDRPKDVNQLPEKIWVETGRTIPPPAPKLSRSAAASQSGETLAESGWLLWMADRYNNRKR